MAGKQGEIQALAEDVNCYSNDDDVLEFRFAQASGTLVLHVAQDMHSAKSNQTMEFALKVDGRQVQTKDITFKQTATLSTPLTNVAVVQVHAQLVGDHCDGPATALITSATVTG